VDVDETARVSLPATEPELMLVEDRCRGGWIVCMVLHELVWCSL
jgi:hypothetical protein